MAKLLLIVPKMFSKEDLGRIDPEIPEDFGEKRLQFWSYVREKLRSVPRITRIYYDSLTEEFEKDPLEFVKGDNQECFEIVSELLSEGAKLEVTEDKISVAESRAWAEVASKGDASALSLLAQSLEERNKKVAEKISQSLGEGEVSVFFVSPSRKIASQFDTRGIKAITIQPFDIERLDGYRFDSTCIKLRSYLPRRAHEENAYLSFAKRL